MILIILKWILIGILAVILIPVIGAVIITLIGTVKQVYDYIKYSKKSDLTDPSEEEDE